MTTSSPMEFANRELPLWVCVLLGFVFIIAGVLVLGDAVAATLISAIFIGIFAIIGGAFEINSARVLDQGMGWLRLADPPGPALHRFRDNPAQRAGDRGADSDLGAWAHPDGVRVGSHLSGIPQLGRIGLAASPVRYLWRPRRAGDSRRVAGHRAVGDRISSGHRPDLPRRRLAGLRVAAVRASGNVDEQIAKERTADALRNSAQIFNAAHHEASTVKLDD